MDPLTLLLAALLLAELGFTRRLGAARARAIAIVAMLLPELDLLTRLGAPVPVHGAAGGVLHAMPVVFFVLVPVVTIAGARAFRPRQATLPCLLLVMSVACTHLALDVLTTSGARLMWPIHARRYALDWLPSPEPVLWCLLSMGLWLRVFLDDALRATVQAVVWSALYVGLQGAAHNVARKRAAAWARLEGFDAAAVLAFPDGAGGLYWNTVAVNDEEAMQRHVALLGLPQAGFRMARGLEEPLLQEFFSTDVGESWEENARVPIALSEVLPHGGYVVYVRDLRHAGRRTGQSGVLANDLRARFDNEGVLVESGPPAFAPPFPQPPRPAPEPLFRSP